MWVNEKIVNEEGYLLIWKLKYWPLNIYENVIVFLFWKSEKSAFYKVVRTSSFMPIHMKSCNAFMKRYHLKNVQKTK